ncbi:winged helix-turn-helix domain-containing protein [Chloroflexota bacterium]
MSHLSNPVPLKAARALALHCQGLAAPDIAQTIAPDTAAIYRAIEQVGCIQIDTLQMVQRSQYIALWSRLGTYDPADFDALIYGAGVDDRRLFEYWLHAACLIPLSEYRYALPNMAHHRNNSTRNSRWFEETGNQHVVALVRERIAAEGGLRTSDFQDDGPRRGSWWNWKPAKRALEMLYNQGELMIADRVNFQRVYEQADRVLPDWVDQTTPTPEETRQFYVERAVKTFGLSQAKHIAEYSKAKVSEVRRTMADLLAQGVLLEVEVVLVDGAVDSFVLHRDQRSLLALALAGEVTAERTTFLSPFDSLFWAKGRDEQFWGFVQRLEAYKPAPERIWGYFSLPILHRDRLVGRFDPKLERKTGILRLKALRLEPAVEPTADLVQAVAATMRDFMVFHKATDLVIEQSHPAAFGDKLIKAL